MMAEIDGLKRTIEETIVISSEFDRLMLETIEKIKDITHELCLWKNIRRKRSERRSVTKR